MYRVVAPLVYLKVPDVTGAFVSCTFYKDAIVPEGAHEETLQRHVDEGMVEEVDSPAPVEEEDQAPARRGRPRKTD